MQIYDFLLEQSCISRCLTLVASQISNFIADTNHFWVQWKITGKAPSFWNPFPVFFPLIFAFHSETLFREAFVADRCIVLKHDSFHLTSVSQHPTDSCCRLYVSFCDGVVLGICKAEDSCQNHSDKCSFFHNSLYMIETSKLLVFRI